MNFKVPTWHVRSSLSSFLGEKISKVFVFQLQGRLGNQMWGLSDAHLLHNLSGKKVLLDLSNCIIDEENKIFYDYISNLSWLEVGKLNFNSKVGVSEIKTLSLEDFSNPHRAIGYRGFSASYFLLKESGLFCEGKLPEFIQINPPLNSTRFISMSFRHGDYRDNSHLGILPMRYYVKALNQIDSNQDKLPIWLFGDDLSGKLIDKLPKVIKTRVVTLNKDCSPIDDLARLSSASVSVISNSTFSFLGAYLSKSEKIFTPKPFYIAVKGWNEMLENPRTQEISYSKFPKLRYSRLRLQKKIRGVSLI
jgi:hypothetical protein